MRLTVIGCSGSFPGPESPASCYLVEHEQDGRTWRILLDLGNGALGVLQRYVDPFTIDAVFLSHLHPDHVSDVNGYYVMRKYHPDGAAPRIPVYGPAGTGARMARAYGLAEDPGMSEEFDFRVHDEAEPVTVGPLTVTVSRVLHPIDAFAIRVDDGAASVVYSGDTAYTPRLVTLADGADLLLAEASFLEEDDNPPGIHMTGKEAGEVASESGVGTLVLTHIPPWHDPRQLLDEAKQVYDGAITLARSGASYEV
jgi:ribonuclease BN (tRNA processing enzyme)